MDGKLVQEGKDFFEHYGVPGMKWGVRRYQKYNGSLTALGSKRYKTSNKADKEIKKLSEMDRKSLKTERRINKLAKPSIFSNTSYRIIPMELNIRKSEKQQKQIEDFVRKNESKLRRQVNDPKNAKYKKDAEYYLDYFNTDNEDAKFWKALARAHEKKTIQI